MVTIANNTRYSNELVLQLVICTYNRARLLINTLDSIAEQDCIQDQRWSVLIVDNNCSDNTLEVIEKYRYKIKHMQVVTEQRQGLTEARQRGVLSANSTWVAFVDDDCILDKDWVSNALSFCARRPDVAAFNGKNTVLYEIDQPRHWFNPSAFAGLNPDSNEETIHSGPLHGAGLVVRLEPLIRSGWLDNPVVADRRGSSLVSGGDNELSIRARAGGGELWYVPTCRLQHHIQADRLGFSYLMRLNFRLAEAAPLMHLLQCSRPIGIWHSKMICRQFAAFLRVVGLLPDVLISSGAGWRGRFLSFSRAIGYVVGYIKVLLQPRSSRKEWCGLATAARVNEMNAKDC